MTAVPGHGLHGHVRRSSLRLGKPGWITPGPLAGDVECLQHNRATVVLIERDDALLGAIAVRDDLRDEAIETIERMRGLGIDTAMLTGDNTRTANALAK